MGRKFRRRIWLIDSDIQVRLGLKIAACLVAYLVLFFVLSVGERFLTLNQELPQDEAWAGAWTESAGAGVRIVTPLLLALGCMLLHGILLLHKLAGPAYRMRLALNRLAEGDLTDFVQLRGGDYLEALAVVYNEGVGRVCADIQEVRRRTAEMLEVAEDDASRERIESLASVLDRYRTGPEAPKASEPESVGAEIPADPEKSVAEA